MTVMAPRRRWRQRADRGRARLRLPRAGRGAGQARRSARCTTVRWCWCASRTTRAPSAGARSWCNFPTCGAEHRARLVETRAEAPLLVGKPARRSGGRCSPTLTPATRVLVLQSGEPGPFAQAIAGHRHRAVGPGGAAHGRGPVAPARRRRAGDRASMRAASIPTSRNGSRPRKRAEGYTAFKLKVGFGADAGRGEPACAAQRAGPGGDADGRRQPGLGRSTTALAQARAARGVRAGLARRADGGRCRLGAVARAARPGADSAGRRRERGRRRGVRRGDVRRGAGRRPARSGEMGRDLARPAARAPHPRGRPALSARTTSAAASACWHRRTCWPRPAATACSRSMRTKIR